MIPFDIKYGKIHSELQKNRDIVRMLYTKAKEIGFQEKGEKIYFPVGEFKGIPIGLDMCDIHCTFYSHILASMRMVYTFNKGKVDLLKIYAGLQEEPGRVIGIVTEDVSCGGKYEVIDGDIAGAYPHLELEKMLLRIFSDYPLSEIGKHTNKSDIMKAFFSVLENKSGKEIRTPIVDLDHLVVRNNLFHRWAEYTRQYRHSDKRFQIHHPKNEAIQQT